MCPFEEMAASCHHRPRLLAHAKSASVSDPLWLGAVVFRPRLGGRRRPGNLIAVAVGAVIVLLAPAFHHLAVVDAGDWLMIRFGPVPLFRRTVRYADIGSVEIGRTLLLDGWGIHLSIRGGWVWNLWGRTCVVIHFKDGGTLRIGTDDTENLDRFLEGKVAEQGT